MAMMKHIPKISVGMPIYNGETYLTAAIESILQQTFTDFELIISDNASTDATREICLDFASRDKRIRYIRNSANVGASANYNNVFREAKGEYFRWFNADDLCSKFLHEKCLAVLESNPEAVLCYGKTDIIDEDGNLVNHYEDKLDLREQSPLERIKKYFAVVGLTNAIYGLMRRSPLSKTRLMGDGKFSAADTNLMAELLFYGKFFEIQETLFFRRMHKEASSWDRKDEAAQQIFWRGNASIFFMPTLKRHLALIFSVKRTPLTNSEKFKILKYLFRRTAWDRNQIFWESYNGLFDLLRILLPKKQ